MKIFKSIVFIIISLAVSGCLTIEKSDLPSATSTDCVFLAESYKKVYKLLTMLDENDPKLVENVNEYKNFLTKHYSLDESYSSSLQEVERKLVVGFDLYLNDYSSENMVEVINMHTEYAAIIYSSCGAKALK